MGFEELLAQVREGSDGREWNLRAVLRAYESGRLTLPQKNELVFLLFCREDPDVPLPEQLVSNGLVSLTTLERQTGESLGAVPLWFIFMHLKERSRKMATGQWQTDGEYVAYRKAKEAGLLASLERGGREWERPVTISVDLAVRPARCAVKGQHVCGEIEVSDGLTRLIVLPTRGMLRVAARIAFWRSA